MLLPASQPQPHPWLLPLGLFQLSSHRLQLLLPARPSQPLDATPQPPAVPPCRRGRSSTARPHRTRRVRSFRRLSPAFAGFRRLSPACAGLRRLAPACAAWDAPTALLAQRRDSNPGPSGSCARRQPTGLFADVDAARAAKSSLIHAAIFSYLTLPYLKVSKAAGAVPTHVFSDTTLDYATHPCP